MPKNAVPAAKVPVEDIRKLSDTEFAIWVKRVEEEAVGDVLARAGSLLNLHAASQGVIANMSDYENGKLDGLEFAATQIRRMGIRFQ